jgi:hypothetical protein
LDHAVTGTAEPRQVEIAQPTYAWVRPCGRVAELGFRDKAGALITLALPHQVLSMLLMTLPQLIETSLRQRTGDASMRHVYPVGSWHVEAAANGAALLLGLTTPDGFAVSFRLPCEDAQRLGEVLCDCAPPPAPDAVPVRH